MIHERVRNSRKSVIQYVFFFDAILSIFEIFETF